MQTLENNVYTEHEFQSHVLVDCTTLWVSVSLLSPWAAGGGIRTADVYLTSKLLRLAATQEIPISACATHPRQR